MMLREELRSILDDSVLGEKNSNQILKLDRKSKG